VAKVPLHASPCAHIGYPPPDRPGERMPGSRGGLGSTPAPYAGPVPNSALPLRGRTTEIEVIRSALAGATSGVGSVVLMAGAAGSGKSRLLQEAAGLARTSGVRAATGGAGPDDRTRPLAALLSALRSGDTPIAGVGHPVLEASDGVRYWALQHVEELLEQSTRTGPLLVALDDLQWADTGTIEALRVLPDQTSGLPLVWILAFRTGEAPRRLEEVVDGLARSGASRVILAPLDRTAAVRLARDVAGSLTPGEVEWLVQRSGGNPFLIVDGLADRLSGASADVRNVARTAAVLGRSPRFEDIATMLDRTPARLMPAITDLVRRGVLVDRDRHLTFRHDPGGAAPRDPLRCPARRAAPGRPGAAPGRCLGARPRLAPADGFRTR
jgi:energy-coupling factor transporter ATP-binding protein EcfA2